MKLKRSFIRLTYRCSLAALVSGPIVAQVPASPCSGENTVLANVVAIDQPFIYNRLGTVQPNGMLFALQRDVVPLANPTDQFGNDLKLHVDPSTLAPGKVRLRSDKRPRPIVLRVNVGSCLEIHFRNLLTPNSARNSATTMETTAASIRMMGLDLVDSIASDGSYAGQNISSLVNPGDPAKIYKYYAPAEGTFFLYSAGDQEQNNNVVNGGPQGQVDNGLFGSVTVEPTGAEHYRSQVTREDLHLATYMQNNLPPNMHLTEKFDASGQRATTRVRKSMFWQEVSDADLTRSVWVLTTQNPDQQTYSTADVVISPDGRLYALDYDGDPQSIVSGHPLINYAALYPPDDAKGRGCTPILKMTTRAFHPAAQGCAADGSGPASLYYTDLTAIITGPNAGRFPESTVSPSFAQNPAEPDRRQPYREFAIHYHNPNPVQAFQQFSTPSPLSVIGWTEDQNNLSSMLGAGQDQFGINYGIAGIGAEVLANRLGVGPMGNPDAVELKFEEFFLTSWAVGDPAMVVDIPANAQNQLVRDKPKQANDPNQPTRYSPGKSTVDNNLMLAELQGESNSASQNQVGWSTPVGNQQRATKVYYPDDPSNVYHSYLGDHVKFRILHAGPGATHVHHLHAHQWLHSPDSDNGDYLDSQMLTPGSSYTLEIAYGGGGNRNLTPGDSIFHCHFYPHFAAGMWSLWRVHDVFESGTELDAQSIPKPGINRALPDGEIAAGTPIPAVVPMPTLAMAPIPADVQLKDAVSNGDHRRVEVIPDKVAGGKPVYSNPGYPFFVPGVAGHRAPHPPLDFAWKVDAKGLPVFENGHKLLLDGGLPRHVVLDGKIFRQFTTRWDFTKDFVLYDANKNLVDGLLKAYQLPEDGTAVEKAAMAAHSQRAHKSFLPDGRPANFLMNGLPPAPGAPFASPGVNDDGSTTGSTRRYMGANIQIDAVLNKKGWHFPQQRMITLWNDVSDTVSGKRAPQPFFFRAGSTEKIEYWQTNLVPNYYELDDFQVRTPTDILGQHIHLVKFDVLASDGGSNGFNYEDGTFSPDEVRERIFAINKQGGIFGFDNGVNQFYNPSQQTKLQVKKYTDWYKNGDGTSTFGPSPTGQNWDGAQTTIQLWYGDPQLNNHGFDRTLRTVFTHDHFGPSTHQQIGLYAGLLLEPDDSKWFDPSSGQRYYDSTSCYTPQSGKYASVSGDCPAGSFRRLDGGPTSWLADIHTASPGDDYREFALEFQDLQLAYMPGSTQKTALPVSSLFTGTVTNATVNALNAGKVTDELRQVFAMSGVTLTSAANAAAASACPGMTSAGADVKWIVSDTAPPDANERYCLADRHMTTLKITGPTGSSPMQTWQPAVRLDTVTQMNKGQVAQELQDMLQSFGVNPNGNATVVKQGCTAVPNGAWVITSNGQTFCAGAQSGFRTLSVLMPDMEHGWADAANVIQAPGPPPSITVGPPYPTLISAGQNGTYSLNYRNEPLPSRVAGSPAGQATDLAFAFASLKRNDPDLNCQPIPGNPIGTPCSPVGVVSNFRYPPPLFAPANGPTSPQPTDPFTPLLRAYQGDRVQIRTLVGAHLSLHSFQIPALSWLFEPTSPNSGHRSTQGMGLSEHFEMLFKLPRTTTSAIPNTPAFATDYVYETSSGADGLANGLWGILRAFDPSKAPSGGYPDLRQLPNNALPNASPAPAACTPNVDPINITAVSSSVTYNSRNATGLVNPNGLLYVRSADVTCSGQTCTLNSGVPVEPLIFRVHAGDCVEINLANKVNITSSQNVNASRIRNSPFGKGAVPDVTMQTSSSVGIQPQLIWHDPNGSLGLNAGFNDAQTLSVGANGKTTWFAGRSDGTPMEGTVLLQPADPMLQHFWGLIGAVIVEPKGATIQEDQATHAAATITPACPPPTVCAQPFRELVLVTQNDVQNKFQWGGINYRTEPFMSPYRFGSQAAPAATPPPLSAAAARAETNSLLRRLESRNASASLNSLSPKQGDLNTSALLDNPEPLKRMLTAAPQAQVGQMAERYSNNLIGEKHPETPILHVVAGAPVRLRYVFAGGYTTFQGTFEVHGHQWEEEPWMAGSTILGHNPQSQVFGGEQIAPYQTSNFLLASAGGKARVPGDYVYEVFARANNGLWGLLRVEETSIVIHNARIRSTNPDVASIEGSVSVAPGVKMPKQITVAEEVDASGSGSGDGTVASCIAEVNADGSWSCTGPFKRGTTVTAGSYSAVVR